MKTTGHHAKPTLSIGLPSLPFVVLGIGLPLLVFLLVQPGGPVVWFLVPGLWWIGFARFSDLRWMGLGVFFLFLILYATSIPVEVYYFWFHQLPELTSGPPVLVLWAGSWLVCLLGLGPLVPSKPLIIPLINRLIRSMRKATKSSASLTSLTSLTSSADPLLPDSAYGAPESKLGQGSNLGKVSQVTPDQPTTRVKTQPLRVVIGVVYCWIGIPVLLSGSAIGTLGYLALGGIYGLIHLRTYPVKPRLAWFGIMTLAVVVILLLPEPKPILRDSWDQRLMRVVSQRFQDIPLILDIPGQGTRQINDSFGPARGLSSRVFFRISSPTDGVFYLENRRASILGTNGWIFSQEDRPRVDPSSSSKVKVEIQETWWGPKPVQLFLNRWYLPAIATELVLPTPLEPNTILNFEPFDSFIPTNESRVPTTQNHFGPAIPQEIIQLADQVRDLSLDQQIQFLNNYLQDQYIYGLLPVNPQRNSHPLSRFLTDQIGYCLHFATFGVLFFQNLGYEAWYSEGYQGVITRGQAEVRGLQSHGWVTLNLPDEPARIIDPTPRIRFDPQGSGNHAMDRATLQYLDRLQSLAQSSVVSSIDSPTDSSGADSASSTPEDPSQSWIPWVMALLGVVVIIIVVLGIGLWNSPKNRWVRIMDQGKTEPATYGSVEELVGQKIAKKLYLPSLEAWYGYSAYANYQVLLRDLQNLKEYSKSLGDSGV